MTARTLGTLLRDAETRLAPTSPSARLDARVLLEHITGHSHAALITHGEDEISEEGATRFAELIEKRALGTPVAHLTGAREFYALELKVTADTLIPRPETELLVDEALLRIPDDSDWTIADLGTGTGAIALAIATARPLTTVIATDASEAALTVARGNAKRLGAENIEFRIGSWGDWLNALGDTRCHMILSNPPYICAQDPHLNAGDVSFEPRTALVAGVDGLDDLKRIIAEAGASLHPGGWLVLEHGFDQSEAVARLMEAQTYKAVQTHKDLAGLGRVTLGRR